MLFRKTTMRKPALPLLLVLFLALPLATTAMAQDQAFDKLARDFMNEFPALDPVGATALGDHRFDSRLNEVSPEARAEKREFYRDYLKRLDKIDPAQLSRPNQVDYALLKHELEGDLWSLDKLQQWAWNPLVYTRLPGSAIYSLMARDFAPAAGTSPSCDRTPGAVPPPVSTNSRNAPAESRPAHSCGDGDQAKPRRAEHPR